MHTLEGKDTHIQGLDFICRIRWQANKFNVLLSAKLNHMHTDMAGQVVTDEKFFPRLAADGGEKQLLKPVLKDWHVKPSRS